MKKLIAFGFLTAVAATGHASQRSVVAESFACRDRPFFERLVKIAVDRDEQAFTRMLGGALADGRCVFLSKGQPVYIEDLELLKGVTKVRIKGTQRSYWTYSESIR